MLLSTTQKTQGKSAAAMAAPPKVAGGLPWGQDPGYWGNGEGRREKPRRLGPSSEMGTQGQSRELGEGFSTKAGLRGQGQPLQFKGPWGSLSSGVARGFRPCANSTPVAAAVCR